MTTIVEETKNVNLNSTQILNLGMYAQNAEEQRQFTMIGLICPVVEA
jgi:hypothetical protein